MVVAEGTEILLCVLPQRGATIGDSWRHRGQTFSAGTQHHSAWPTCEHRLPRPVSHGAQTLPRWCLGGHGDFFQQVPLQAEHPVLGTQSAQLLPLGGGEPVAATASVQIGLPQPVTDDLTGAAQGLSEFIRGAPAFAD